MEIVNYGGARTGRAANRPEPSSSSAKRARVAWVDAAKGICIILVVTMHSTLGVGDKMGGEGFMHWAVAFAKPFRMPDFFLVSGLFLGRVIDRDWRSYADRRVLHFAYFYLLWLAIQSVVKYGDLSEGSPAIFLQNVARQLYQPTLTLWFIYVLAIFSVVTKLTRGVPQFIVLALAAALEILPIETDYVLVDEFCARWVYFLAGYMLAPRIFALAGWAGDNRGRAAAALAVWAAVEGALAFMPSGVPGFARVAELPGIGLLLGGAGALAIVSLASVLTRSGAAGFLRHCGQNSIAIYLAFFLPMALTRTILVKTQVISDIGIVSLVVTVAGVLVPLAIVRLVRGTPMRFLFARPAWCRIAPGRTSIRMQPAE